MKYSIYLTSILLISFAFVAAFKAPAMNADAEIKETKEQSCPTWDPYFYIVWSISDGEPEGDIVNNTDADGYVIKRVSNHLDVTDDEFYIATPYHIFTDTTLPYDVVMFGSNDPHVEYFVKAVADGCPDSPFYGDEGRYWF